MFYGDQNKAQTHPEAYIADLSLQNMFYTEVSGGELKKSVLNRLKVPP
jgi:hypothetical protein